MSPSSSAVFSTSSVSLVARHFVARSRAGGVHVLALVNLVRRRTVHRYGVVVAHRVYSRRSEVNRARRGPLAVCRRVATPPTVIDSTSVASFVLPRIRVSALSSAPMKTYRHPVNLPPNQRFVVTRLGDALNLTGCHHAPQARRYASAVRMKSVR